MPFYTLDETLAFRLRLRQIAPGIPFVLVNGVFDLLHEGHFSYLTFASRWGIVLVALNSDASVRRLKGEGRPVQSEDQRAVQLLEVSFVQGVFIFDGPRLAREIRLLQPDVYVKGGDYTLDTLDPEERAALEEVNATIRFAPYLPGFSTTSIIATRAAQG